MSVRWLETNIIEAFVNGVHGSYGKLISELKEKHFHARFSTNAVLFMEEIIETSLGM